MVYIHTHMVTHTLSWYEHYLMWGRTYTLYKNVMESHDSPGRGSAKCRMVSAAALVSVASSSLQMSALHDGSSSLPSPCSQHSITARRQLSSDWCCWAISSSLGQSYWCDLRLKSPRGISPSPSFFQATLSTADKMFSTVRGGAKVERRREGGDSVKQKWWWSKKHDHCRTEIHESWVL